MQSKYAVIEGFSNCIGVNSYPSIQSSGERRSFLHRAVNRSCLKLLNDTRPPFVEIQLIFQSTEEEYTFRNAAISGMKFYQGESSNFSAYLIVSVGDLILAGVIKPNSIEFFTIYKGIDPQWTQAYWCQALNILTYCNDKDLPLYWTGELNKPMKSVLESAYIKGAPMKVSNVACYAHGRIFYATPNSLVYASDYIYSQGLSIEKREAVLANKESEYPSSGDGFGAPSEMGQITGAVAIPQSNTLNGFGDVIITCRNGAFSIAPNRKLRNEWTNDPEMQKHILLGKGCVSNSSITSFANQILYRDSNGGMSSLLMDVSNYQQQQELVDISNEVFEWTRYDANSSNIQFSDSFVTNNRVINTVCIQREISSHMGVHRYALGMISACLQRKGGNASLSWEGLWTGPRVVGSAVSNVGNSKKTILASYDTDNQNRLYYIDENAATGEDFRLGKYQSIEGKFSVQGLFFDEDPSSAVIKKTIEKLEVLLIESNPDSLTATYTTESNPEEYPIKFQLTDINGCGMLSSRALSRDICNSKPTTKTSSSKDGYYFGVTYYLSGKVKFAKWAVAGTVKDPDGFQGDMQCDRVKAAGITEICFTECNPKVNDFNYTF